MQDETNIDDEGAEQAGPLAGQLLAEAREKKQITITAVAKELHIDEFKIKALEENRFAELGAPVYAKGYLRRYAEFVGADSTQVFADYYRLTRQESIPAIVVKNDIALNGVSLSPRIILVVLLVIVAAVLYVWLGRSTPAEQIDPAPASIVSQDEPNRTVQLPADEPGTDVPQASADVVVEEFLGDTREPDSAVVEPVEAIPAPTETVVPAGTDLQIELTFSSDCWTEINDATGRALFVDLARAGTTKRMSGVAPIRVLLGDSQSVRIQVNGRVYAIPDESRSGLTARFTIDKQ